jgi:hypothetical protein
VEYEEFKRDQEEKGKRKIRDEKERQERETKRIRKEALHIEYGVGDGGGVHENIYFDSPPSSRKTVLRLGEREGCIGIKQTKDNSNTIKFSLSRGHTGARKTHRLGTFTAKITRKNNAPPARLMHLPTSEHYISIKVLKTIKGLFVSILDEWGNPVASNVKKHL